MSKVICLEGLPGSGKSTLLDSFKSDFNILTIPEILDTSEIWEVAKDKEDQDFFWANDISKMRKSRNATDSIVLVDRGYVSTLAYNYAKYINDGNGDYLNLLTKYHKEIVLNNFKPDYYVYLSLDVEHVFKRKNREVEFGDPWKDPKYMIQILEYYDAFFKYFEPDISVVRIDSNNSWESVLSQLSSFIAKIS